MELGGVSYLRGWVLKSLSGLFWSRSKFTPPKVSAFAARNGRHFFVRRTFWPGIVPERLRWTLRQFQQRGEFDGALAAIFTTRHDRFRAT